MKYLTPLYICLFFFSCAKSAVVVPSEIEIVDSIDTIIKDFDEFQNSFDSEDQHWPDLSESRNIKELNAITKILNRLEDLDKINLSAEDQINREMLSLILTDWQQNLQYETHLFPLNAEGGFLAGVIYGIQGRQINTQEKTDKHIQKLKALPDYFQQRISHMREGLGKGKTPPQLIIHNCVKLIDHLLETDVEEQFFLASVQDEFKDQVRPVVIEEVIPAYQILREFLTTEYVAGAPTKVGASQMADGKEFYENRVRYFTTFDVTPQEVFDTGMKEVARIKSEMEDIIQQVGFEGDFAAFLQFLRTDEQFYPKSGRELLNRAAWITKEMEGELPKYFGKLPRMPLTVKPVPDALAPNYTGGRYSPGSYENNQAGQYWVNTYKLESRPYYVLPALSLHEGVPGHHLQIMLAAELENLPDFRKTYISAFGEGWGLYSEYLGKEAGMYKTPYEEFGALTYEMWRACRLVVDPGMHYMDWTREQAVDFMASNTALSMHEVNTEIDRYIGWPAQAVSYKMGELKIRELRKNAEDALGEDFDIRAFHDAVLENGSIPLTSLEMVVDRFIGLNQK